jgi:hypothetical protein
MSPSVRSNLLGGETLDGDETLSLTSERPGSNDYESHWREFLSEILPWLISALTSTACIVIILSNTQCSVGHFYEESNKIETGRNSEKETNPPDVAEDELRSFYAPLSSCRTLD